MSDHILATEPVNATANSKQGHESNLKQEKLLTWIRLTRAKTTASASTGKNKFIQFEKKWPARRSSRMPHCGTFAIVTSEDAILKDFGGTPTSNKPQIQ